MRLPITIILNNKKDTKKYFSIAKNLVMEELDKLNSNGFVKKINRSKVVDDEENPGKNNNYSCSYEKHSDNDLGFYLFCSPINEGSDYLPSSLTGFLELNLDLRINTGVNTKELFDLVSNRLFKRFLLELKDDILEMSGARNELAEDCGMYDSYFSKNFETFIKHLIIGRWNYNFLDDSNEVNKFKDFLKFLDYLKEDGAILIDDTSKFCKINLKKLLPSDVKLHFGFDIFSDDEEQAKDMGRVIPILRDFLFRNNLIDERNKYSDKIILNLINPKGNFATPILFYFRDHLSQDFEQEDII